MTGHRRYDGVLARGRAEEPDHERVWGGEQVDAADDPAVDAQRGRDVHVQGLGAGVDAAPADDDAHLHHARAVEEGRGLDTRGPLSLL